MKSCLPKLTVRKRRYSTQRKQLTRNLQRKSSRYPAEDFVTLNEIFLQMDQKLNAQKESFNEISESLFALSEKTIYYAFSYVSPVVTEVSFKSHYEDRTDEHTLV